MSKPLVRSESIRPGVLCPVVFTLAAVVWPPAPTHGADPPRDREGVVAEAVLSGRGLKRVGNLYLLLDSEISADEGAARDQASVAQLNVKAEEVRGAIQQGEQGLDTLKAELRHLIFRRDDVTLYARNIGGSPALSASISQLQAQIIKLYGDIRVAEAELHRRGRLLEEIVSQIAAREDVPRRRAEVVTDTYRQLAADPEVVRALKQLNRTARPWVMIGPESEYASNVVWFARVVLADAGLRLDVRRSQVSLASEAEARALGHRAWVLSQKLNGLEGARNRREMVQVVDQLRRRVGEIQRDYETLPRDPLITEAVEQCARSLGRSLRVAPTADFLKEVRRLPTFEHALERGP